MFPLMSYILLNHFVYVKQFVFFSINLPAFRLPFRAFCGVLTAARLSDAAQAASRRIKHVMRNAP
jgi:hypothetical protein